MWCIGGFGRSCCGFQCLMCDALRSTTCGQLHGQRYEDAVRKLYERYQCVRVVETGLHIDKEHRCAYVWVVVCLALHSSAVAPVCELCVSWLGASPDGLIGEDGLLEIKCPTKRLYSGVPWHYMAQVQGQLHILDRRWCDFVCWWQGEVCVSLCPTAATSQRPLRGLPLLGVETQMSVTRVYRCHKMWAWLIKRLTAFFVALQASGGVCSCLRVPVCCTHADPCER